jgi:hypothetical protein
MIEEKTMSHRSRTTFITAALPFAGLAIPIGNAQQTAAPVKAVQLTGLNGVENDAKGTLTVENSSLHFVHRKETADLSAASIEDVVTGSGNKESIGKTAGDTLTVQYRDADGGLHGAIFTMPIGAADGIKGELLAQGAHTTTTEDQTAPPASATNPPNKDQKL